MLYPSYVEKDISPLCVLCQPLERDVDVALQLARNGIAAHLARNAARTTQTLQIQPLDELAHSQSVRQVALVAKHKQGNATKCRLRKQLVQL